MEEIFSKLTEEDQEKIMGLVDYAKKFHDGMQIVLTGKNINEINEVFPSLILEHPKQWTEEPHDLSALNVLVKHITTGSLSLRIKICKYCNLPFFAYTTDKKIYCNRLYKGTPCSILDKFKVEEHQSDQLSKLTIMMKESLSFHKNLIREDVITLEEYNEYERLLELKLNEYRISPSEEKNREFLHILLKL